MIVGQQPPHLKRKLSLAGCTTTPYVSAASSRDISHFVFVCVNRSRCSKVYVAPWVSLHMLMKENLDRLSVKDIGNTALLMGQT